MEGPNAKRTPRTWHPGSLATTWSCVVASVSAIAVAVTVAALCAWFVHGHVLHCAKASDTASATASSAKELA